MGFISKCNAESCNSGNADAASCVLAAPAGSPTPRMAGPRCHSRKNLAARACLIESTSSPYGWNSRGARLNKIVGLAFAVFLLAAPSSNARADDGVGHTVLSPEDLRAYQNIFAAEKTGQLAKSDALAAKLEDKSLTGYVLAERYLGPHHHSQFDELKTWLAKY